MVAKCNYDKGISVLSESQFNYDGGIRRDITVDEARAVFDYSVVKEQSCRPNGTPVPRQFHLVRTDVDALLDTSGGVGEEFDVTTQPLDVFDFITKDIMPQMPDLRIETAATMYNGATCFINLSFREGFTLPNDTSRHFTNLIYCNPLSRGRVVVLGHSVRVVCMNTLAKSISSGEGFRISHTSNGGRMVEVALKEMRQQLQYAQEQREKMEFLASKEILPLQAQNLLETILPMNPEKSKFSAARTEAARSEVMEQFEKDTTFTKPTFWSFFSANSYLSEHPLHKQSRVDDAQVAFENIIGSRSNRKNQVFDAVFEMAKAA